MGRRSDLERSSLDWKPRKLNELGFVGRGKSKHRPRNDPSLYGGPYPFFQTGDIKAADFYLQEHSQTYNEKGLAQSKLWERGTLCITIAANIADTAILKIRGCFPDSVVGFIADKSKVDVRFVKYYIDTIKMQMQSASLGTTQDNLSLDKLLTFDILTPQLPTQEKIAAILSAYDDLIENNTRRIRILEEMAQAIYREWFVHFRFPGHKKVKLVNSPLGQIPDGWRAGRLDEAVVLQRGFDLPGSSRRQGNVPVYAATGVVGKHDEAKVNGPGVVTGRSGSLGTVNYVPEDYWPLNTTLWVKEFRRSTPLHAYFLLSGLDFSQFNSGAAVPTLNRNDVHGLPIVLPPAAILEEFDKNVASIYELISSLRAKNDCLRRTRDLLLPKLISGELDVSDLDINVGDAAA
jgi:type I restriction enzyme S subunit